MGQEIPYQHFNESDVKRFKSKLAMETQQLEDLFKRDQFAKGDNVAGLELEAWLVDEKGDAQAENVRFLEKLNHPDVVPELSLFNIELNVEPKVLRGSVLDDLYSNLVDNWQQCVDVAQTMDLDVLAIGSLPSLLDSQLTLSNMSKSQRYKVLNEQIFALRKQRPIKLDINGREHLCSVHEDVMLEAATTSFQIHMQVEQAFAAHEYNAAQVISAPLVALAANSPYVFGVDLWDESRIPIFEQSIELGEHFAQRVCFGERYIEQSLFELFRENQLQFAPLIPMVFEEEAFLPHLRLHNGTVWRWNRPIVALGENGTPHLRIENRVVPSGPSLQDMIANAAFFWGSVRALRSDMKSIQATLPFALMRTNFYRAVKDSLACQLTWLDGKSYRCSELILDLLLPSAEAGLIDLGIEPVSAQRWLDIIRDRVISQQNGAAWQRAWVAQHGRDMEALSRAYLSRQKSGLPVHQWSL